MNKGRQPQKRKMPKKRKMPSGGNVIIGTPVLTSAGGFSIRWSTPCDLTDWSVPPDSENIPASDDPLRGAT